jgi:hypothetical protein
MTEPVEVPTIERLRLEPGDILVLTYQQRITAETAVRIEEQLKDRFGAEIPVCVIDSGGRLQVVNKAELASASN